MDQRDLISSLTHLLMAVWAVLATVYLHWRVRRHGLIGRRTVAWFGFSLVFLYLASGLFHGLIYLNNTSVGGLRDDAVALYWVFQKLDKSAIFLLIAMSNVVVMVYLLPRGWRFWSAAAMLGFAAFGIGALWLLPNLPHAALVGIYAGMGVSGLVPMRMFARVLPVRAYPWVAAFAGLFLTGAAFEVAKWPVVIPGYLGPHEMLHLAIMAGSFVHFLFVSKYVICQPPRADLVPSGSHPARRERGRWGEGRTITAHTTR